MPPSKSAPPPDRSGAHAEWSTIVADWHSGKYDETECDRRLLEAAQRHGLTWNDVNVWWVAEDASAAESPAAGDTSPLPQQPPTPDPWAPPPAAGSMPPPAGYAPPPPAGYAPPPPPPGYAQAPPAYGQPPGYGQPPAYPPAVSGYPSDSLPVPPGSLASPGRRFAGLLLTALLVIVTLVIGYLIWALIVYKDSTTPAKRLLHMRIVDSKTGQPLSYGRMLMRQFVWYIVLTIGSQITVGILGLVDAFFVFTREHQRLLDRMASTLVVYDG